MSEDANVLDSIADQLEQRQLSSTSPILEGATADDIRALSGALFLSKDQDVASCELWEIIQLFCETSDKWLFPEDDPIGRAARPMLEEIIRGLSKTLNQWVPGMEVQKQHYFDLRELQYCAKRAAILRKRNPSGLDRFFENLGIEFEPSIFFRTLFATTLYQCGKTLSRVGKLLGAIGKIGANV